MTGPAERDLDLLVLGEINPDIIVRGPDVEPRFGQEELLVESAELVIGSSSAIMAVGAARLGLRVALVGIVGDDALGRFMLDALGSAGVDVSGCRTDPSQSTGASVILTNGSDRAIMTALGTIGALRVDHIPAALLSRARHVHVGSYFMQTGLRADLAGLFDRLRAAGTTTSVDPNWDPAGTWDGGLVALLDRTSVFLPNRHEALQVAGLSDPWDAALALTGTGGSAANRNRNDPGGPDGGRGPVVVVKLGADGALVASRDGGVEQVAAYPVDAVDTTGAGDSFDAGFLAAWLEGRQLGEALRFGAVCGALSTTGMGGTSRQPTRAEVEASLSAGWP
ncbi:MAG TPA: carbohydrate kinase family protein [Candidatus Limnocylindrales bacterium]